MRVLFLDIDGVLNDRHLNNDAKSSSIRPECMKQLNRVIKATDCKLVISSAWRYMVHGGAMTLSGFEYMLRTHGLTSDAQVIGVTQTDESAGTDSRGRHIATFISEWNARDTATPIATFVAVDDCQLGYIKANIPHVITDGDAGLSDDDADKLIHSLSEPKP